LPQLRERKRGYFSRGGRAFLHFHEDADELYADVRLTDRFERLPVSTFEDQAALMSVVRKTLLLF
jgi:hypothetical protein